MVAFFRGRAGLRRVAAGRPWEGTVRRAALVIVILMLAAPLAIAAISEEERQRIDNAVSVVRDMAQVPPDIWAKANCVGVIPSVKKAAFMFGGEYGKGVFSCRTADGWSAPAFFELEKGSWGLQIGAQSTDLVLLVMNQSGIEHLLQDKFTLGGGGSVAAGPVGRAASASTDAAMHAEILSYSRARGAFAGIDLSGGVLKPDKDANTDVYGADVTPRQILITNTVTAPPAARPFLTALVQTSRQEQGLPAKDIR